MKKLVLLSLIAVSQVACATFEPLTAEGAYTDPAKGVWLAKSSSFLGLRTASQQVLFCKADGAPICTAAGGDVGAAKTGGEVK
jgi:hypothetical protein